MGDAHLDPAPPPEAASLEDFPLTVVPAASAAKPVRRDAVFRRLLAVADLLAAAGGVMILGRVVGRQLDQVSLVVVPLIVIIAKATGRYDHDDVILRKSTLDEIPHLLSLAASFALIWSIVAYLAGIRLHFHGAGLAVLWGATSLLLVLTRTAARMIARVAAPPERALVLGSPHAYRTLADAMASDPAARVEVVGFVPFGESEEDGDETAGNAAAFARFEELLAERDVDRVFLVPAGSDRDEVLEAVTRATARGVKVSIVPRLLEVVGSAVEFDTVGGITLLGVRRLGLSRSSRAIKRTTDIVGAALGLAVSAPVAAVAALAIKLDSPGPVLFRQPRVGRHGRVFNMFKFRSMVADAEIQQARLESLNESVGTFKLNDDPRVTRVGRVLRRLSIDELPQLINVLRGDMSLVGPRPLLANEDRLVSGRHRQRLQLAPGMTGPWQVLGPRRPPLSEMVKTDYLYVANWSLWSDVKILLRTFLHMATRRGR